MNISHLWRHRSRDGRISTLSSQGELSSTFHLKKNLNFSGPLCNAVSNFDDQLQSHLCININSILQQSTIWICFHVLSFLGGRVPDSELWVSGFGFRVSGFEFRILNFGCRVSKSDFGVRGSGIGVDICATIFQRPVSPPFIPRFCCPCC